MQKTILGVSLFLATSVWAQDPSAPREGAAPTRVSGSDQKFIEQAADSSMAEVRLGQLAVRQGNSEEVKRFGQHMVDDHTKATDELKNLASQKGASLPADVSSSHKKSEDKLSKMTGE